MELGSSRDDPLPRPSARVVLLDRDDRLLLFRTVDPDEDTGKPFWFTVGGGLEPGEDYLAAALRELREETGLEDVEIGPCIWLREHTWLWQRQWFRSIERYFLGRTLTSEITEAYRTEVELQMLSEHRWWSAREIAASTDIFVPRRLAELLPPLLAGDIPREPFDTGV